MMIMKDSTGIVNKVFRLIFRRSKMNSVRREASNHSRLLSTVNHALENLILELSLQNTMEFLTSTRSKSWRTSKTGTKRKRENI